MISREVKISLLASLGDLFQGIGATKKLFSTPQLLHCFFVGDQVAKYFQNSNGKIAMAELF